MRKVRIRTRICRSPPEQVRPSGLSVRPSRHRQRALEAPVFTQMSSQFNKSQFSTIDVSTVNVVKFKFCNGKTFSHKNHLTINMFLQVWSMRCTSSNYRKANRPLLSLLKIIYQIHKSKNFTCHRLICIASELLMAAALKIKPFGPCSLRLFVLTRCGRLSVWVIHDDTVRNVV